MCGVLEEMRMETAREATKEAHVETAQRLLRLGKLSYEEIAEMVELPIEEVKALEERVIA